MRFAGHEIVNRVETPELGSWLVMKRHDDGAFDRHLWARITSSEGQLVVIGDWSPVVFAHCSGDPRSRVGWIGARPKLDSYVIEKADIGSRPCPVLTWDADAAREDLVARLEWLRQDPESESGEIAQLERVLATWDEFASPWDSVDDFLAHVQHEVDDSCMWLDGIGMRPSSHLKFAFEAVRRLHELLQAEGGPTVDAEVRRA